MANYWKNDVILVRYPFSDLSNSKIGPAIIVSSPHTSQDVLITPLTSKTQLLLVGEFILSAFFKILKIKSMFESFILISYFSALT